MAKRRLFKGARKVWLNKTKGKFTGNPRDLHGAYVPSSRVARRIPAPALGFHGKGKPATLGGWFGSQRAFTRVLGVAGVASAIPGYQRGKDYRRRYLKDKNIRAQDTRGRAVATGGFHAAVGRAFGVPWKLGLPLEIAEQIGKRAVRKRALRPKRKARRRK